jgi:hypothetical protein
MFVLFAGLAKSTKKQRNSNRRRFFEPLVLYVRDEIAIQTLVKKL